MSKLGTRFNRLWAATAISNLGDGVMGAAFPLLVASITRDPVLVAGAVVVGRLPWFLFALFAGAVVDRMDRRLVMVRVDWFRAMVVGLLGVLLLMGDVSLAVIYVAAFLLGSAETLFDTASEAIVPALVTEVDLEAANGRLQGVEWASNAFVGPPLGALLFTAVVGLPFLFDAGTFVAAAVLVATIGGGYRSEQASTGTLRAEALAGLRWLWSHTVLRTLSIMAGITNLVSFAIIAIWVLYVQDEIGLGELGYGLLLTALGVGGLLGAFVAAPIAKSLGQGTTLILSVAMLGAGSFVVAATSEVWVVAVTIAMIGLSISLWNVVAVSLRQGLTPDHLRGRVAAVARLVAWGSQPLGALAGGVIADALGLRAPFYLAGAAWVVLLLVTVPVVNNSRIAALKAEAGG